MYSLCLRLPSGLSGTHVASAVAAREPPKEFNTTRLVLGHEGRLHRAHQTNLEPRGAGRCTGAMDPAARPQCACVAAALLIILVGGCASSQGTQVKASPTVPIRTFAGGCAGTVLTDTEPPVWAQAGWRVKGAPWPVPWAFGTPNTTVAFVFSKVLVAGSGPRVDGTYNKVTWVAKDRPAGVAADYPFGTIAIGVEARPLGESQPVLTGASVADLPKPGCWTFRLAWSAHGQLQASTINLEVLPAGSQP